MITGTVAVTGGTGISLESAEPWCDAAAAVLQSAVAEGAGPDAVLDRLVHNAYKIKLKGESMRKLRSTLTKKNGSER